MTEQSPIVGDLVEEYREVVLPARGRVRAGFWFAGQLASLVRPWMWGAALGFALGIENFIATSFRPLAEDSPPVLLGMMAIMLSTWSVIGFRAARRHGRWFDGVSAAFVASTTTMVVSQLANFARVLVFADQLQYSGEWSSLMARYHASGMTDLQAFVFLDYARNTPIFVATLVAIGTLCGAIGASISAVRRERPLRARA